MADILNVKYNGSWMGIPAIQGRGISSITKTGTSGLVDTYTITYDDSTTSTFTVTNGADAELPSQTGNSGKVLTTDGTDASWISATQISDLQQALAGKVDLASGVTQANVDYVVETYVSGTSWYRVYKSGWCEQGGHIVVENGGQTQSVLFLKTFANDNYALTFAPFASGSSVAEANFRCSASSASGCTFYNNSATGVTYRWVACGYLA